MWLDFYQTLENADWPLLMESRWWLPGNGGREGGERKGLKGGMRKLLGRRYVPCPNGGDGLQAYTYVKTH